MMVSSRISSEQRITVIDGNNPLEIVRVMHEHSIVADGMGGIVPQQLRLTRPQRILDVACGPGMWVLDAAYEFPECEVIGVDISRSMIDYALAQAEARNLYNAVFQEMDICRPLAFTDCSFDVVHARFINPYIPAAAWPVLVREYARVLRPGGIVCLTEAEKLITGKSASEELATLCAKACKQAGHSFSHDGFHMAITPMLRPFLYDARFRNVQKQTYILNFTVGKYLYHPIARNHLHFYQLLQPFLLKMDVVTAMEYEWLYQAASREMLQDNFEGRWFFMSVWGRK